MSFGVGGNFRQLGISALLGVFATAGSSAMAEGQMVAQMACQEKNFDGKLLPRVMVLTQAEINPRFTNSVAPEVNPTEDFQNIEFKIEIFPFEGELDFENEIAAQVKELRATTSPEPGFDFKSLAHKEDDRIGVLENDGTTVTHILIGLSSEINEATYAQPPKQSFIFSCKRFYLTEFDGE